MTRKLPFLTLTIAALLLVGSAFAQTDPGVRTGAAAAGGPLASVAANNPAGSLTFFNTALDTFREVDSVSGTIEAGSGLGPRFNSRSCAFCHAQPATGGSSPFVNPQVTDATADGARNTIPSFITTSGPVREVRFPFFFDQFGNPDTTRPNGGVEDLFTITGRSDAGACNISQPSFAQAQATGNIIFRIPTPTFGAGLMENIDETTLLNNLAANSGTFGISGALNRNGNDGTITRFGWKAQNKSLHIFSGEAYNVEMGISNLVFTQDRPLPGEDQLLRGLPAGCLNLSGTGYPEDTNNPGAATAAAGLDDASGFANFMRTLAPPPQGGVVLNGTSVSAQSIANGSALFSAIGCATCHNPVVGNTQKSKITGSLSNAPVNAFSDIEIHHMGSGLADNVSQGGAGGDQFRTAPLWGLGQRIFLLHDGRN